MGFPVGGLHCNRHELELSSDFAAAAISYTKHPFIQDGSIQIPFHGHSLVQKSTPLYSCVTSIVHFTGYLPALPASWQGTQHHVDATNFYPSFASLDQASALSSERWLLFKKDCPDPTFVDLAHDK